MTIHQAVRRKITIALSVSAICVALLLAIVRFWPDAPWAWTGTFLMLGAITPLLYAVWLVSCPKCNAIFGQRKVFNVAFNLAGILYCPNCGAALDQPSHGP
ncbi:hypothetical protein [Thermomonas sp.]|uniref:hypothetical protein n=1 Tax=Thermomonas sp. TaxID=1971895 RepID=UPI0035B1F7E0